MPNFKGQKVLSDVLTTFSPILSKMASFKNFWLTVNSVKTAEGVIKKCGLRNTSPWLKTGKHIDLCHMVTVLWHMVIYIHSNS